MSTLRVALRYTQPLLQLAIKKGVLTTLYQDMRLLLTLCNRHPSFSAMLKSPLIDQAKKRSILQQIFKNKVDPLTLALFETTTKRSRENMLPTIAKTFVDQYHTYQGIKVAHITTPFKLTSDLKNQFKTIVQHKTRCKKVNLATHIDPTLVGGYILRVEDQQLDESLRTKLSLLKTNFIHTPLPKKR